MSPPLEQFGGSLRISWSIFAGRFLPYWNRDCMSRC